MLAIIAALCFLLTTFGVDHLGPVGLLPLGLAFLALHFVWSYMPWTARS